MLVDVGEHEVEQHLRQRPAGLALLLEPAQDKDGVQQHHLQPPLAGVGCLQLGEEEWLARLAHEAGIERLGRRAPLAARLHPAGEPLPPACCRLLLSCHLC